MASRSQTAPAACAPVALVIPRQAVALGRRTRRLFSSGDDVPVVTSAAPASGAWPSPGQGVVFVNWRDLGHPEGGGSELYVETVAAGLAARGERVTVFCAAHPGAPAEEWRNGVRYVRRGGRFTVYPRAALLGLTGRFGRHDVIIDVQNGIPFFTPLWSRRKVIALVHHVHREQWPVVFGRMMAACGWWIESRVAPRLYRSSHYVTVSEVTKTELVSLGVAADRVCLVYNGTAPAIPSLLQKSASPRIVVLGRLVPHKRVELLLQAVACLLPARPDLRVDIVGSGWWERELRDEISRLGLDGAVTLHGHVDEQTKHDLLATAWVHAVPSLKEGWGLSVVEAAVHATPSIAFASGGGLAESIVCRHHRAPRRRRRPLRSSRAWPQFSTTQISAPPSGSTRGCTRNNSPGRPVWAPCMPSSTVPGRQRSADRRARTLPERDVSRDPELDPDS